MRRLALFGVAFSLLTNSAVAQNCDGFVDVLASSPFCPDVTWLATYGITKGCAPSQFCPNDSVTRLQMAAFMHRLGSNPAFVNGGNAFGTRAALGTTDHEELDIIVNGARAIAVLPAIDSYYGFNPNVVAGQAGNSVGSGMVGATIAGGGGCNPPGTGGSCSTPISNQVTGMFGTVGGGFGNTISGGVFSATIAGGFQNTASGISSTVVGGNNNSASGNDSTVLGGALNSASGFISVAAGNIAHATHDNSFVWSGWEGGGAPSFFTHRFHVGAEHGFSVDYCSLRDDGTGGGTCWVVIGDQFSGQAISTSTGAYLSSGGSWNNASDRAVKTDFTAVDAQAVLAKVALLPIDQWSYKVEGAQRHLGPVAQDFYAAFGLGADDKHISTVDEGGVALAAIQGLHELLQEKDAKIEAQQRRITELEDRMAQVESLRTEMVALKAMLTEMRDRRESIAQADTTN